MLTHTLPPLRVKECLRSLPHPSLCQFPLAFQLCPTFPVLHLHFSLCFIHAVASSAAHGWTTILISCYGDFASGLSLVPTKESEESLVTNTAVVRPHQHKHKNE